MRKWRAIQRARRRRSARRTRFMRFGQDGWREFWAREAFILRESRLEPALPETDLFAGLA